MELQVPGTAATLAAPIRGRRERVSVATCGVRDRADNSGNALGSRGHSRHTLTPARSALTLSSSSRQATPTKGPITRQVLEIAGRMDDPKASDLKFLFDDAKLLHQQLTALNTEGVDLKKMGLFSGEQLEKIEASATLAKRPRPVYTPTRKPASRNSEELHHRASLASSGSLASLRLSLSSASSSTLSLNGGGGTCPNTPKKAKSLKRSIFGAFSRSRSKSGLDQTLVKSLSMPRYSLGDIRSQRAPATRVSLSRPNSPQHRRKPPSSLPRSSSLDFLDRDDPVPDSSSAHFAPLDSPLPRGRARTGAVADKKPKERTPPPSVCHASRPSPRLSRPVGRAPREGGVVRGARSVPTSPVSRRKFLKSDVRPEEDVYNTGNTSHSRASTNALQLVGRPDSDPLTTPTLSHTPSPPLTVTPPLPGGGGGGETSSHTSPAALHRINGNHTPATPNSAPATPIPTHHGHTPSPQPLPTSNLALNSFSENEPTAPKSTPAPSGLDPRVTRPSVATLVDELTQVEEQVGGGAASEDDPGNEKEGGVKRPNVTASSATLELDELMQNLEDFVPPAPSTPPGEAAGGRQKPKSAMDDLSNMLGSLEQDMEHIHGVSTVAKGMCAACKKPILAKVLDALGRQWHPEHFTCASCEVELSNATYYESNGRPYCEKDYHELYAPRCAYCNGPILERVMRALDKTWHPEHFFCTLCGKKFGPEGFHEKDGKAFCRECYYENYAPHCKRCDKAIMEGFITALNAQWHPECFSCKVCQVTFPRGNYFEHEGEPHCELHYHASRGTLCASCQKPVTGKCVTAMGRKWHPEHFTCAFCLKLLNKGTFKEHRHNPYCQPCYIKLFG